MLATPRARPAADTGSMKFELRIWLLSTLPARHGKDGIDADILKSE